MKITHLKFVRCIVLVFVLSLSSQNLAHSKQVRTEVKPSVVKFGVWVIDIDVIDSAAQSFGANVFLRMTWKDQRLVHREPSPKVFDLVDVWSPGIQIANEVGRVQRTLPEIVQVANDGTVVYKQRYVGNFSQPLRLHDFPFDEQLFRLHFIKTSTDDRRIEFIPDEALIAAGMDHAAGISKDISLPEWIVKSFSAGPLPYELTEGMQATGYAFDFIAERDSEYYVYKVVMPLVLIVLMSWVVFWTNPREAGTKIGISTASMLTLIAYRFMVDHLVPKVSYMTRLDEFILGSTLLVFFSLLQATLSTSLTYRGKNSLAMKIDAFSRFVFPLLFVLVVVVSFRVNG